MICIGESIASNNKNPNPNTNDAASLIFNILNGCTVRTI